MSLFGISFGVIVGLVSVMLVVGFVGLMLVWGMGLIVGIGCFFVCIVFKLKLKYDDLFDVFGIYGVGGILGVLMIGIFVMRVYIDVVGDLVLVGLIDGNWFVIFG